MQNGSPRHWITSRRGRHWVEISSSKFTQMENSASRPPFRARTARAGKASNDQTALFSPTTASLFQTPEKQVKEIIRGKNYKIDKVIKSGKHGQVAFGHGFISPSTAEFACKTQSVRTPGNHNSRAYREYLIFKQLNQLRRRPDIYPNNNFVGFIRLLDGFKGYESPSKGGDVVLNLLMEKAECTLHEHRSMPIFELRSVLFQLIFALMVAQREYEFVHRDLHLQVRSSQILAVQTMTNQLKTECSSQSVQQKHHGSRWKVQTSRSRVVLKRQMDCKNQ
jgi:hypothetical protein